MRPSKVYTQGVPLEELYGRTYVLKGGSVTLPVDPTFVAAIWRLGNTTEFSFAPPISDLKLAVCWDGARYLFWQWRPEYPVYNGERIPAGAVIELTVDATGTVDDITFIANEMATTEETVEIDLETPPGVYDTPFSGATLIYAH